MSMGQSSGQDLMGALLRASGGHEGVTWASFSSGDSPGKESASQLTWVVGRIQFSAELC